MIWLQLLVGVALGSVCFLLGFCVGWTEGKRRCRVVAGDDLVRWIHAYQRSNLCNRKSGDETACAIMTKINSWAKTGKVW